jgi:hypothetical protein
MLVPLWKIPVAIARSRGGIVRATTRSASGQFGDSQNPSSTRIPKSDQKPVARAAAAPASDQAETAAA